MYTFPSDSYTTVDPTPGPDDLTYVDWIIIGVTIALVVGITIGVCVWGYFEYKQWVFQNK